MDRRNFLKLTGATIVVPSIYSIIKADDIRDDEWMSFKDKLPEKKSFFIIKIMHPSLEDPYYKMCQRWDVRGLAKYKVPRENCKLLITNLIGTIIDGVFIPGRIMGYGFNIINDYISWKPYFSDTDKLPEKDKMVEVLYRNREYDVPWQLFIGKTNPGLYKHIMFVSNKQKTINIGLISGNSLSRYWRYI